MEQEKKQDAKNNTKRRKRRGRKRGRFGFLYHLFCLGFGFLYHLFCLVAVCLVVAAGCIVFFKANHIEITGLERYTAEEIQEAADVEIGDNLFLLNKFAIINRLSQQLPYLDTVDIRRKLPDTLIINVVESVPVGVIAGEGGYWIVDKKGKLLEQTTDLETYPEIVGLSISDPVQGSIITLERDDPRQEYYADLFSALADAGMIPHLEKIDLSGEIVTVLQYEDRLEIRLDVGCDYDYKASFLYKVLQEELGEDVAGVLDFMGKNARYIPDAG